MAQHLRRSLRPGLNETRMISIVGDGFGASASSALCTGEHAQHGTELVIGLDGDVTLTTHTGEKVSGAVVMASPDIVHRVTCPGPAVAMIYDCDVFAEVAGWARQKHGIGALDAPLSRQLRGIVGAHAASLGRLDVLDGLAREVAQALPESRARPMDRRVQRVLRALRDPNVERPSLLRASGLSEAHLQALFARDVGLSIRSFRLWQRVLSAVLALRRADATFAAHQAGFADLPHFSRTCARMLGYPPSAMQRALRARSL